MKLPAWLRKAPYEPEFNPRYRLVAFAEEFAHTLGWIAIWLIELETRRLERRLQRIERARELHVKRGEAIREWLHYTNAATSNWKVFYIWQS